MSFQWRYLYKTTPFRLDEKYNPTSPRPQYFQCQLRNITFCWGHRWASLIVSLWPKQAIMLHGRRRWGGMVVVVLVGRGAFMHTHSPLFRPSWPHHNQSMSHYQHWCFHHHHHLRALSVTIEFLVMRKVFRDFEATLDEFSGLQGCDPFDIIYLITHHLKVFAIPLTKISPSDIASPCCHELLFNLNPIVSCIIPLLT